MPRANTQRTPGIPAAAPSWERIAAPAIAEFALIESAQRTRTPYWAPPWVVATIAGDASLAHAAADNRNDPNEPDSLGMRALDWLGILEPRCPAGWTSALLAAGADPGVAGAGGKCALHWAALGGQADMAELAPRTLASVDQADWRGSTALTLALGAGNIDAALALARAGANPNAWSSPVEENGKLWRHAALGVAFDRLGDGCMWRAALGSTDGSSAADEAECPPAAMKALELVHVLLNAGANPNQVCWATRCSSEIRIEYPAWTRMFHACRGMNPTEAPRMAQDLMDRMLAAGLDTKSASQGRSTALHWAGKCGFAGVARSLLRAGADIEARDDHQATPLFDAARKGAVCVVQLLLEHGANPLEEADWGESVEFVASMSGNKELSRILAPHVERARLALAIPTAPGRRAAARL